MPSPAAVSREFGAIGRMLGLITRARVGSIPATRGSRFQLKGSNDER